MKIKSKLLLSYILLIAFCFILSMVSFHLIIRQHIYNEARTELEDECELLVSTLGKIPLNNETLLKKLQIRRQLNIAGSCIDSYTIIRDINNKIVYTNFPPEQTRNILQEKDSLNNRDYIMARIPIKNSNGKQTGTLLMVSRVQDIKPLNKAIIRSQLFSFLGAGIISLVLALLFARSLTKPIHELSRNIRTFSVNKPYFRSNIRTGDEIGELSSCFDAMADNLKSYDEKQLIFLQNTSHELKTPLMSIQGYAEAVRDGVVESEQSKECLDIIISESQHLKDIVEEIIYLSKLETFEEEFNLQESNLKDIIMHAVQNIMPLAEKQGITVNTAGNIDFRGHFDHEKLERAFLNILSNCIRYAQNTIDIQASQDNAILTILISDDGPGFKAGEEYKIFDRFYKGERGSSGLGLTISKTIFEGHDGTITAANHLPHGALFTVKLPIKSGN